MTAPEPQDPDVILKEIVAKDPRYRPDAYRFVFEALEHTIRKLGERRHVTGKELCEGLRDLARQQFGGLARMVLHGWGIRRTEDVGELVFNLVQAGLMGKTDQDTRDDFRDGFDFSKAFPLT